MKFELSKKEIALFITIGAIVASLPLIFTQSWSHISFLKTGPIGDTIGGITAPFIAFFGAILVYLALKAQIEANTKIQQQFETQKTESQFYTMLNIHIQNVDKFEIQEFDVHPSKQNVEKTHIDGRRVFLPMIEEFHVLIKIIYKFYNKELDSQDNALNRLAYQIFFFGIDSNHVKPPTYDDTVFPKMKNEVKNFQDKFREKESKTRNFVIKGFGVFEVRTRFVPFAGHESRLAHYYRHLYQTVKQIYDAEMRKAISYNEARRYLATLRAQLSNQEQLLLYYNYMSGFGQSWDRLGGRYQFLTEYRMLHNIPLDDGRISTAFENPRKHFQIFIKSNRVTKNDPLFEWGDFVKE